MFFISMFFFVNCYSQIRRVLYSINPDWNNNSSEIIKAQNIKSDSVYSYEKKNYRDSILIMIQYFDSLGNLIEWDEYNNVGKIFKVTNYTYIDTMLLKQESVGISRFSINGSNLTKIVKTFDHDDSGNVILEKEYSFSGDSLKFQSVTIEMKEYDSLGHLIREFETLPKKTPYLHHTYHYTNGILNEVKTYDFNHNWMYSYNYEYDDNAGTKSVYLVNGEKTLTHEYFYNDQKKLIKETDYGQGDGYVDHSTQKYFYKSNGLVEDQVFEDIAGKNHYYKHIYSK